MRRICFNPQQRIDCHVQMFRAPDAGIERCVGVVTASPFPFGLGGTRQARWDSDAAMLEDCMLLAQGMKYKSLFHQLPYAGAKCCVELVPGADETRAYTALGEWVRDCWTNLLTTEDLGTSPEKVAIMHRVVPDRILGRPVSAGGSGDPSPYTARGVWQSIKSAAKHVFGRADRSVAGLKVFLKGVGHVGTAVANLLLEDGAELFLQDLYEPHLQPFLGKAGVTILTPERVPTQADIFCPCAKGGDVGEDFDLPGVRAIVGAANNQLQRDEVANLLHQRGILYVPDWVANGGGLISVAAEHQQKPREWVLERAMRIGDRVDELLTIAAQRMLPPLTVAYDLCEQAAPRL